MSDDLVKRLRDWEHVWPQDLDEPEGGLYLKAANRIEELKAKLAKAVEALGDIVKDCEADYPPSHGAIRYFARTTLAELTGGKDE